MPRKHEQPQPTLIHIRPRMDTVHVSQGRTALISDTDGFVYEGGEQGLFFFETRHLSEYRYLINGKAPQRIISSNVRQNAWMGYYIAPAPGAKGKDADPAQHTIELRLSRFIGDGMHEDVDLANFTQKPVAFNLALVVDADFAAQGEVHEVRKQHGKCTRRWRKVSAKPPIWDLHYDYRASHRYDHQGNRGRARIQRGTVLRVENAGSAPRLVRSTRSSRIEFHVKLRPKQRWHACVITSPIMEKEVWPSRYGCYCFLGGDNDWERRRAIFLRESTDFETQEEPPLSAIVARGVAQAKHDLDSLRLHDLDRGDRAWVVAAGVPTYLALFGRDPLTAAWQASILGPELMRGALGEAQRWQGKEINDWRDEQPGRLVHEVHRDPLAMLGFNPKARYYGGVTASIYYPTVLASLWQWMGSKDEVLPFVETALEALRWADRYLDLDGDGFYEYKTRSTQGMENQGWKDSGDAIVYDDGSQVKAPIATCEMQAFVYVSKLQLSAVLWGLGRRDEAKTMFSEATELKKRFNEKFWMEDLGFIAMALDSKKRQVRSIASDPGHCLASGIIDTSLVPRFVRRFLAPDLFSGWGIRTLSADHPAFDPFSYHRGSVWPVENGVFPLALVRYGLHREAELLARSLFEAASLFDFCRLPEVFSGHQRDREHPFPAVYPRSDWPQAWSAGALLVTLQALLGLYPFAPLKVLIVNPVLPEWLPEMTVTGLRVGKARATIRFFRKADGTSDYEVLEKRGNLHVIQQPSPWSLTEGWVERIYDLVKSLLPGR